MQRLQSFELSGFRLMKYFPFDAPRIRAPLFQLPLLLVFLSSAPETLADSGPKPWIHSLIQKGQDVEVTFEAVDEYFYYYGAPAEGMPMSVYRRIGVNFPAGATKVFDDTLSPEDATYSIDGCAFYEKPHNIPTKTIVQLCEEYPQACLDCDEDGDPECFEQCGQCWDTDRKVDAANCESFPFQCFDCDGDCVGECPFGCSPYHYFVIVDKCVPARRYKYTLEIDGPGEPIVVVDSGIACDQEPAEIYSDPPLDVGSGGEESSGSCDAEGGSNSEGDSNSETGNGESNSGPGASDGEDEGVASSTNGCQLTPYQPRNTSIVEVLALFLP